MTRATRSLGASLVTALVAVIALVWWVGQPSATERTVRQQPDSVLVRMDDYSFAPKQLVWTVGQRVRLTLVNDSQSNPARAHEFMLGQNVRWTDSVVGRLPQDGFATDFFRGVSVAVLDQTGVQMLMPGMAAVTGMSPTPSPTGMPGMPGMPGMTPTPSPTGMPGMPGMTPTPSPTGMPGMPGMPGMTPTPSPTGMPGMASVPGMDSLMVVLAGGGRVTLDFTVPDLPGTWTFACFQQSGQHYLNGMSGQVTVVR
ncbi:MAG: hypothetical protein ACOYY2_12100 [Actinomycetota bacterium]